MLDFLFLKFNHSKPKLTKPKNNFMHFFISTNLNILNTFSKTIIRPNLRGNEKTVPQTQESHRIGSFLE